MKFKDTDFTQYDYKRIKVPNGHGFSFFPQGYEEAAIKLFGECEIADENGIEINGGFLCITFKKENDGQKSEENG